MSRSKAGIKNTPCTRVHRGKSSCRVLEGTTMLCPTSCLTSRRRESRDIRVCVLLNLSLNKFDKWFDKYSISYYSSPKKNKSHETWPYQQDLNIKTYASSWDEVKHLLRAGYRMHQLLTLKYGKWTAFIVAICSVQYDSIRPPKDCKIN